MSLTKTGISFASSFSRSRVDHEESFLGLTSTECSRRGSPRSTFCFHCPNVAQLTGLACYDVLCEKISGPRSCYSSHRLDSGLAHSTSPWLCWAAAEFESHFWWFGSALTTELCFEWNETEEREHPSCSLGSGRHAERDLYCCLGL